MRTLIRESTSAWLGATVARSGSGSEAEPGALLSFDEAGAVDALTRLTVGLGVLVTGLAVALAALAIFQ